MNIKYVPKTLSKKDQVRQRAMIRESKRLYNKGIFFTRKHLKSYSYRPSKYIARARQLYGVTAPGRELERKTGCFVQAQRAIVRKGMGAYSSSGSRPNQTPHSWGLARLASALTGGPASVVDYDILESGCDHKKCAFQMARH